MTEMLSSCEDPLSCCDHGEALSSSLRQEIDNDWDFDFQEGVEDSFQHGQISPQHQQFVLPKQLHPAVSLGVRRVSSCYFSLQSASEASNSVADLLSLLEEEHEENSEAEGLDVLYHDVLMHVLTFLDVGDLQQCSQTTRRLNFECFYFLQLQLERAILTNHGPPGVEEGNSLLSGYACLSRLAERDRASAQDIVNRYLESNSTLQTMPLSYSLAYLRHVLQRQGLPMQSNATKAAALFIAMVGAASSLGGMELDSAFYFAGPTLFGLAGLAATKTMNSTKHTSMGETAQRAAQDMAKMMQQLPKHLWQHLQHMRQERRRHTDENRHHEEKCEEKSFEDYLTNSESADKSLQEQNRRLPSGCVGAYAIAVREAKNQLASLIREERLQNYRALTIDQQEVVMASFLQACMSDSTLGTVRDMCQRLKIVPVDHFHVGLDGNGSCALHTAAFNGACRVLEFLVQGVDPYGRDDGGLADVNIRDSNNWTAMHFCAGANSVDSVRILASNGAQLALEANNGYTPFHWAQRLSNHEVANELQRLGGDQRFLLRSFLGL